MNTPLPAMTAAGTISGPVFVTLCRTCGEVQDQGRWRPLADYEGEALCTALDVEIHYLICPVCAGQTHALTATKTAPFCHEQTHPH